MTTNTKPELNLLSRADAMSAEKLAKLFTKLTGKTTTPEEMQAAMAGAKDRAEAYKKNFRK